MDKQQLQKNNKDQDDIKQQLKKTQKGQQWELKNLQQQLAYAWAQNEKIMHDLGKSNNEKKDIHQELEQTQQGNERLLCELEDQTDNQDHLQWQLEEAQPVTATNDIYVGWSPGWTRRLALMLYQGDTRGSGGYCGGLLFRLFTDYFLINLDGVVLVPWWWKTRLQRSDAGRLTQVFLLYLMSSSNSI